MSLPNRFGMSSFSMPLAIRDNSSIVSKENVFSTSGNSATPLEAGEIAESMVVDTMPKFKHLDIHDMLEGCLRIEESIRSLQERVERSKVKLESIRLSVDSNNVEDLELRLGCLRLQITAEKLLSPLFDALKSMVEAKHVVRDALEEDDDRKEQAVRPVLVSRSNGDGK